MAPSASSIKYFISAMENHNIVSEIKKIDSYVYKISRGLKREPVIVLLTDTYVASEADVIELLDESKPFEINAIILIGFMNMYADDAKARAKKLQIGLFKLGELMGAINYTNNRFIDYEPKGKNN